MPPTVFAGSGRLRPEGEWRRVRTSPFTANVSRARAWQAYIDNLELQKILPRSEAEQLRGTISRDPTGVEWLTTASEKRELSKRMYRGTWTQ